MLQPLGISAEAEAVYVVLSSQSTVTLEQMEKLLSVGGREIAERLGELRKLGLALELAPDRWQALPLPEVAKALRVQRLSELELAVAAAESLQNRLMLAAQAQSDDIRVLVGRDAILPVHREIFSGARTEICMFDKPPYVEERDATEESLSEEAPEWQALQRGSQLRCIYHPGFDNDRLKELTLFASKGEVSRAGPVPMKLIIVDARVAMIPSMRSYLPGHELIMSVVHHPTLVEALQWLFEAVWDTAIPIVAASAASSDSDPRRQMLISLLMTGSTDTAIASNLGINVRSVRRWIADLMDELGVTTRLQLGAALVRQEHLRTQTQTASGEPTPVLTRPRPARGPGSGTAGPGTLRRPDPNLRRPTLRTG
jgi:DNA-binding CsgD family transcriptional regulator